MPIFLPKVVQNIPACRRGRSADGGRGGRCGRGGGGGRVPGARRSRGRGSYSARAQWPCGCLASPPGARTGNTQTSHQGSIFCNGKVIDRKVSRSFEDSFNTRIKNTKFLIVSAIFYSKHIFFYSIVCNLFPLPLTSVLGPDVTPE